MGPFDDWLKDLADIGPLYPLVGPEGIWVTVVVFFWIGTWLIRSE